MAKMTYQPCEVCQELPAPPQINAAFECAEPPKSIVLCDTCAVGLYHEYVKCFRETIGSAPGGPLEGKPPDSASTAPARPLSAEDRIFRGRKTASARPSETDQASSE